MRLRRALLAATAICAAAPAAAALPPPPGPRLAARLALEPALRLARHSRAGHDLPLAAPAAAACHEHRPRAAGRRPLRARVLGLALAPLARALGKPRVLRELQPGREPHAV